MSDREPDAPLELVAMQTALGGALVSPVADRPEVVAAAAWVFPRQLSREGHVDIYRQQFWLRHLDALREDYRGVATALGPAWHDHASRYLIDYPSVSFTLRDLGEAFPGFLRELTEDPGVDRKFLADLADYEWALVEVFDGPEQPAFGSEEVAAVSPSDWASLSLLVISNCRVLACEFPVTTFRDAVVKGDPTEVPDPEPSWVLVFRRSGVVHYDVMNRNQYRLFQDLRSGTPLALACSNLVSELDEGSRATIERDLSTWFRFWTERGLFCGVRRADSAPT